MLFNSLTFVVFFAVVLALHNGPFSWRWKKFNLLIASYLFYAAWNPPLVMLLWLSTLVDWFVAKRMFTEQRQGVRRGLLFISIFVNLGILASFKYGSFLIENFAVLTRSLGFEFVPAAPDIVLPIGISFYTFQTMAYSLDVYRRKSEPAKRFLDFALFVTFFPQLVAGPIVRPDALIPQFDQPVKASANQMMWGLFLITLGLFQKIVVADALMAPVSDKVFASSAVLAALDAWSGVMAFSAQIFCDFAGYSTAAIGAAMCLGFYLPRNFNFPYAAVGFSDFWRRWHISLSSWLRDYLYIPLGGNRKGPGRTKINLMLTMLLGGLWHGAQWTFVVWGGLHGLYLMVENWLKKNFGDRPLFSKWGIRFALGLLTWVLVLITWVFFRSSDFQTSYRILGAMFFLGEDPQKLLTTFHLVCAWGVTLIMLTLHWSLRNQHLTQLTQKCPTWLLASGWATMLFLIIISQGSGDAFIYFQF